MSANYGVCIYRRGTESGTLDAEWLEPGMPTPCRGCAVGGPADSFEGSYKVTYFCGEGGVAAQFDLTITRNGKAYLLSRSKKGQTACTGIGMPLADGGIALAYHAI